MPFLTLNGRRVFYRTLGDGPPVILLHNATSSTQDWRQVMPRLAEAGYQAIAYDRPGFGQSQPVDHWPLDYLHQDREDLVALLDALGFRKAALIGNSDGATISLLTAASYPERVAAVVAESPHMWYEKESLPRGFQHFQETLGADPRFWKLLARAHGDMAQQVIARWQDRWLDPAFSDWDERAALPCIQCPVLVIHGAMDPFFPVEHSRKIAEVLDKSQFVLLQDVGHVPHSEIVFDYTKLVINFLSVVYPFGKSKRVEPS